MQGGVPTNDAIIGQVTEDSAAQVAGLKRETRFFLSTVLRFIHGMK